MKMRYIGFGKISIDGNNIRNGEVVELEESRIVNLNANEWEKTELKKTKKKKEVIKDGKIVESERDNSDA